ncbi:hypothetical protein E2C01_018398 [Portunus trituberculatus]|uniref:Uncharacterized protein n=1 Tax=Portunus trituberculatus TaxID=210409 RepID=A0A5B7DUE0_PORTR|nr:hypothetical protein [Portunus trituberculatus]
MKGGIPHRVASYKGDGRQSLGYESSRVFKCSRANFMGKLEHELQAYLVDKHATTAAEDAVYADD